MRTIQEKDILVIGTMLEEKGFSHSQIDEYFLEHFGVAGMKWGVRRNRRANTLAKVGRGEGTKGEKLRAYSQLSPLDIAKGRGLRGGARVRGNRQLQRNARVKAGEGSVRDKLAFVGGSRYQDIFPTGKSAGNTKAAVGASIAGVLLVSVGSKAIKKALTEG